MDFTTEQLRMIHWVTRDVLENDGTITISSKKNLVLRGKRYRGCFFGQKTYLITTTGSWEWFSSFIHEYCHFLQHKDEHPLFSGDSLYNAWNTFGEYLDGKIELNDEVRHAFDIVQGCELDCEKRAVEIIQEFGLNINLKEYIQRANAYIFFFEVMLEVGTWWVRGPKALKHVTKTMPGEFLDDYTQPSEEVVEEIKKYCFNLDIKNDSEDGFVLY